MLRYNIAKVIAYSEEFLKFQLGSKVRSTFPLLPCSFALSSRSFSQILIKEFESDKKMHSEISKAEFPTFTVITIPATADNFMYLIVDKSSGSAAAVDPVEPETVLAVLQEQQATLTSILTTHHHWDHAGGNEKLTKLHAKGSTSKLEVFGGDSRIEALTKKVGQGDVVKVGSLEIQCLHTPCHTTGHICYFLDERQSSGQSAVFTGDTLFVAGCGRFFEGTPPEMYDALVKKLGSLPDETMVFCGHEYTVNNLKFSLHLEPDNDAAKEKLLWSEEQRAQRKPTVPSTIGEEKKFNPFMRVTVPALQDKVKASDAISCMGIIRSMKDKF